MTRRIPHADTEVRQAFQKLTKRSDVLTTGASGELLYGQGVGVTPEWGAPPTADHGGLDGLDDDDHGHYFNEARGDARYFTEAEHLNTSAGAADAGKPIKLDAAGVIDSTMLDIVATDEKVGVDSGATEGYLGAAYNDGVLRTSTGLSYADGGNFITLTTNDGEIVHDNLSGAVANEHIDHTSVTLTAGSGLTGTGDISANRTFDLDINSLDAVAIAAGDFVPFWDITATATNKKITFANFESTLAHDSLSGYDANDHVDHTGVTLTAGSGMAGGGDISTGRTFDLDINSLSAVAIAAGDFIPFWDITATATNKKITFANFEGTLDHGSFAGIGDDDHTIYLLADGSRDLTGNLAVDPGILIDGRDLSADGGVVDEIVWLTVGTGLDLTGTTLSTEDTEIVHDDLSGYDANEHVDHTGVSISTGTGLSGGGTIASTRTLTLDINGLAADTIVGGDSIPFYDTTGGACDKTTFTNFEAALTHANLIGGHDLTTDIDHDLITNYDANKHVDHTGVSMTTAAGSGLSGGGDISSTRTLVLSIDGLTGESAIAAADTIPFYDDGVGNRKVTLAELSTALGAADVKVGVDVGATADYLGAASNDGCLRTGATIGYTDGGNFITLALTHLGIEALSDAGADRILFWDDDQSACKWLEVGVGLTLSGTTLTGGFTEKAYARAATGVNQDVPEDDWIKLTLGTVEYDPGSDFADSTYTVPTTGYYLVIAAARTDETFGISESMYVWTYVDGVGAGVPLYKLMTGAGTALLGGFVINILYLEAEQTVELYTYHDHTENRLYNASAAGYVSLVIHRIS